MIIFIISLLDLIYKLITSHVCASKVIYERAQLTLTDLEKMVGKKDFQTICGEFIQKPNGKPTLAPESDKRPVYNPKTTAAEDFK